MLPKYLLYDRLYISKYSYFFIDILSKQILMSKSFTDIINDSLISSDHIVPVYKKRQWIYFWNINRKLSVSDLLIFVQQNLVKRHFHVIEQTSNELAESSEIIVNKSRASIFVLFTLHSYTNLYINNDDSIRKQLISSIDNFIYSIMINLKPRIIAH